MFPEQLIRPYIKELTDFGFISLETPEAVDTLVKKLNGTFLLVINGFDSCSANQARPAAKLSLKNEKKPDFILTVMSGHHREATARIREYFFQYPPSTPSIGLFKDRKLVHFLERHHLEGRSVEKIASNLQMAYDKYCSGNIPETTEEKSKFDAEIINSKNQIKELFSEKTPPNVFISYAREDVQKVNKLYEGLIEYGFNAWKDDKSLMIGDNFDSKIEDAIETSDFAIVCLSKKSVSKIGYINKEFRMIVNTSKYRPFDIPYTLPIKLDGCTPPKEFKKFHWLDVSDFEEFNFFIDKLANQIKAHYFKIMRLKEEN